MATDPPRRKMLAPGLYSTARGLTIDVVELLEAQGYPATPENIETFMVVAEKFCAEHGHEFVERAGDVADGD